MTPEELWLFGKLDTLYKVDKNLFEAYVHFMQKDYVELGLIEGMDVVEKFKILCGTRPNPMECENGTLRKIFGKKSPRYYNKRKFFLNAVHKSNTIEDAKIEAKIFQNIFRKY